MNVRCPTSRTIAKRKGPKIWAITVAIVAGIALLCLAIGIPTRNVEKISIRELTTLKMPFNFSNDKFAEFKYFVETIQHKWLTRPEELLNFEKYGEPDDYGHSGYAVEDSGLIVEFYYFENKLYQSTIHIQDANEAKKWVGYLDSKFGEKESDGKFYYWNKAQMRIVYAYEPGAIRFYFVHMQTFLAGQEYKKNVTSKLARFMEFKKVVDNRVNWNADPESVPNISFFQTNELYKWDVYTHTKITNLDYHFFQNRLCGIDFYIWDKKQAKNMDGILQIKFGEGQSEGINGRRWDVNGITVMSTPYTTARRFMFRHQETWTEKEKYEKKYATTAN